MIAQAAANPYSRTNPYTGQLLVNSRISGPESEKETCHFEISIAGSGFRYEPGDSMAVYASNDPELVEEIIHALGAKGDEIVPAGKTETAPLRQTLLRNYSITTPTPKFLKAIVERAPASTVLSYLLEPSRKHDLYQYLWGMEVIDFLVDHPSARFTPSEFVGLLSKLQPRLYSIASSLRMYPQEVHLMVDVIRYESHGRIRKGVASTFLADRASAGVPMFPAVAKHFHLPEDPDTAVIMVGPGTGLAPFRAFVQDRQVTGARGRNWLFFGSQRQACDFSYREDLESFKEGGMLARLDTAFSRDQGQKVYVQHRMLENAREIWRWLEEGAHFYVCGDASRMAKDVDAALHRIVREQGGKSVEETSAYVEKLKTDKRYKRDVY
jgi:Sulfite reductase, alpha subunit (flavoprotein)